MQLIPLQAIPNQSFNIQLAGINYNLSLRDQGFCMSLTLLISNLLILSGARVLPDYPLIPYRYLEQGNFVFQTANNEYPTYTRFGIDQFLIYASQNELDAFRAGRLIVVSV